MKKFYLRNTKMKYKLIGFLIFISPLVYSGDYDFYNSDMQKFMAKIGASDKGLPVYEIEAYLNNYNKYLAQTGEPLFREIYSLANTSNYNLNSEDNIPIQIQLVALCTKNAISVISQLKDKTLRKEDIAAYAAILNCASIIRITTTEINKFKRINKKFLKKNSYYEKVKLIALKSRSLISAIDLHSMFYLGYLLHGSSGK